MYSHTHVYACFVCCVYGEGTRVNRPHMDICENRFVHNVPIAEPCVC